MKNGNELFEVFEKNERAKWDKNGKIRSYDFPFNFEFRIKNKKNRGTKNKELQGSGIYLITYQETIIYIGKYMPYNKGNVITERWLKHIATITNRGHKVGGFGKEMILNKVNPKYEILKKFVFEEKSIDTVMKLIKEAKRSQDTGFSTSIKRLEFAEDKWNIFQEKNPKIFEEIVLSKFQFHYIQLNKYKKGDITELYDRLESVEEKEDHYYGYLATLAETYLLWKYNPACNSNIGLNDMSSIKVQEIKEEINSFIENLGSKVMSAAQT